jgi:hypothetical protein
MPNSVCPVRYTQSRTLRPVEVNLVVDRRTVPIEDQQRGWDGSDDDVIVARVVPPEATAPLVPPEAKARLVPPEGASEGDLATFTEPVVATLAGDTAAALADDAAATLADDVGAPAGEDLAPVVGRVIEDPPPPPAEPRRGIVRRVLGLAVWLVQGSFCIVSLVVLLAVLTAIPVLQLIAFGYLLSVAGRLADGVKLRDSLPHLREAGMIGMAASAVFLASLPTQLLVHWESVAYLINPGSNQALVLRVLAIASAALMTGYLMWAWIRGGRLRHYLWPQPKRFIREGWRPSTWGEAPDRLWDFTTSLQLPKLFWLGARGAIGTLIWLIPAMIIIAAFRNGETGLAGVVGFVALVFLGISLLYLPMLQAHFAAENRLAALFEVKTIRRDFRRAPWAWLVAMVIGLVLMPIPLYLLKIEATQSEVMWAPCLIFVAFILPARVAEGLALRRARRRPEPTGRWAGVSRWTVRLMMPAVVAVYLLFVYVSQYTSWDGLDTWVQQHAILIPVPFLDGV